VARECEKTHPYIDFKLALPDPNASLWLLLGEAKSKGIHIARTLLHPQRSRELMQVFLTKGVLATTAIEGNTLSEEEVRRVIEDRSELPPSKEYLAQEVRNVIDAYNVVKDDIMRSPDSQLTPARLQEWNRLILSGLALEQGVVPGRFRETGVAVGNYKAPPARDVEYLVTRLCEWLNGDFFTIGDEQRPEFRAPLAILKAVMAHLYFVWIHPFGDGNGRTARLLELQILLAAGFPAPATQLLSNHYNQTRTEYYRQLRLAGKEGPVGFLTYALRGFVDGLAEQLDLIFRWQRNDRWEQYVYQQFGELRTEADRRRLRLVLEVSKAYRAIGAPVPRDGLRWLSPKLSEAYSGKTDKTLTRDLNAIEKLELLKRDPTAGYKPNDEVLLGFLPERVDGVLSADRMSLVEREPPAMVSVAIGS
jgi:Fic family protein